MFGSLFKRAGPDSADALIAEGNRAEDAGDLQRACKLYRRAVASAPGEARAHLNLGIGLEASGDAAGARACYEKALAIDAANAAANYNLGKLLYTQGAHAEAKRRLGLALQARAQFPEARIVRGYVLHALGELEAAAEDLQAGLQARPQDVAARAALASIRGALAVRSALEHHAAGRSAEAQAGYRAVLQQDPGNADALHFLGVAAHEEGRHDEAAQLISRSLEVHASNARAQFGLGRVREAQGRSEDALASYRSALAILDTKLDDASFLCDLGAALKTLGQAAEALESYRKAVQADPNSFDAHFNLGVVQRDLERSDEAIASFRRAIELKPDLADTHFALGNVLRMGDRMGEALACFEKALALDPDHVLARWSSTMARLPAVHAPGGDPRASRRSFAADLEDLERWFDTRRMPMGAVGVGSDQPFALAYQEQDNRELLARYGALCTRLMAHWQQSQAVPPPVVRAHRPVRIGVVSAHFRSHSVWTALTKGWFAGLDASRFALIAFDVGSVQDAHTAFAKSRAADYERGPKELRQWVDCIRAHEPDVLLYPEIGMHPMTTRLASLRLAPVQAASWGHPETTGLPTIDYFLSAQGLEPPEAQAHYTERLVELPHLGCHFDPLNIAPAYPDPAHARLDAHVPLLVCPGVPFKYAPQYDWVLPEIARRLGRCRFVFFAHGRRELSERLAHRLRAAFDERGLDYERFVSVLPWHTRAGFLGWLCRADVYLDTIGFSGFNTALYAVDSSLPIVTREGRFLRGRLASGILKRLGLQELVVPTEEAYIELAVKLVEDSRYSETVSARMEAGRAALYEDPAPVRALEQFLARASGR